MRWQTRTMSLSAGVLAFAACASPPPYAALPIRVSAPRLSNVQIMEATLYDILRVGEPTVQRVKGTNQLEVGVPIMNTHYEQIQVLVQVVYLDATQQEIGDETNRQVRLISPGETITHSAMSRKAEALDWVMYISWDY
ncbi:MAG TPA: hypothetical protein VF384_15220 [Planctomycetota bacterium]